MAHLLHKHALLGMQWIRMQGAEITAARHWKNGGSKAEVDFHEHPKPY